jgi:hypothetical protein
MYIYMSLKEHSTVLTVLIITWSLNSFFSIADAFLQI